MKISKIKNVVLAAALAVGLGVTGISATAQAAERRGVMETNCEHPEEKWTLFYSVASYDTQDNNRFTHTKYITYIYRCEICASINEKGDEVQEPHDLVYNYVERKFECSHCDYWEY